MQFKSFLTVSLFFAILIYAFISNSHTAAASSDSTKSDLTKNSGKNSKSYHTNDNSSQGNNNTKQNEMSIQICDKSHPCKSGPSKENLQ
ncbi:MAG TPA: hypothetical protein VH796_16375 [Nitrososphaeraceae archaeon]